jgi:putative ABC transport system permease protein
LARLVEDDSAALEAFRAGSVVTTSSSQVRDGELALSLSPRRRTPENRWTLPATVVEGSVPTGEMNDLFDTWVSEETVRRMGLVAVPSVISARLDRAVTSEDVTRLAVHGLDGGSPDTDLEAIGFIRLAVGAAAGLLTLLVVGMTVALSSAEGRADQATMAAVGAGPWRRRSLGAMHGLFLGLVGLLLGVVVGLPAGAALMQVDGAPGVVVPWTGLVAVMVAVPLLGWVAGWLVTSTRLTLVRRTG